MGSVEYGWVRDNLIKFHCELFLMWHMIWDRTKKIEQIENEAIDCIVVGDVEGFVINFDFKILNIFLNLSLQDASPPNIKKIWKLFVIHKHINKTI